MGSMIPNGKPSYRFRMPIWLWLVLLVFWWTVACAALWWLA